MAFTQFKHSGTLNPEISVCEKKHSSFAEKAAEEAKRLETYKNSLSKEELEAIVQIRRH